MRYLFTFEKPEREGFGNVEFGPYENEDQAAWAYQRVYGEWPEYTLQMTTWK
jgi:hypothetical protein